MIKTTIVTPGRDMQRFIRAYEIRRIESGSTAIHKPLHAFPETFIAFMLNCSNPDFTPHGDEPSAFKASEYTQPLAGIMGVQTYMRGAFIFRGSFSIFNIHFHAAGFHELFGINAALLTDRLFNAYDFIGRGLPLFHDQLNRASSDEDRLICTERYLQQVLAETLNIETKQWTDLPRLIEAASINTSIDRLASMTNMSVKSFERKFISYVGVAPKLFAQICRFNRVLEYKRSHPDASWSQISNRFGFYDQMHLVKEFKHFAGQSPTSLFNNTPPPAEVFSYLRFDDIRSVL